MRSLVLFWLAFGTMLGEAERVGSVEFYGYDGIDIEKVRSRLHLKPGQTITDDALNRVEEDLGRDNAIVSVVCCDIKRRSIIFIGLSSTEIVHNAAPEADVRLAPELADLPPVLTPPMQARLREYVLENEPNLQSVLKESMYEDARTMAAVALGFGRPSPALVLILATAASDRDEAVRAQAMRALATLLRTDPKLAIGVSIATFLDLLNSPNVSDRINGSVVLAEMSDPETLAAIKAGGLSSLKEMAHWRSDAHAAAARTILARIETH